MVCSCHKASSRRHRLLRPRPPGAYVSVRVVRWWPRLEPAGVFASSNGRMQARQTTSPGMPPTGRCARTRRSATAARSPAWRASQQSGGSPPALGPVRQDRKRRQSGPAGPTIGTGESRDRRRPASTGRSTVRAVGTTQSGGQTCDPAGRRRPCTRRPGTSNGRTVGDAPSRPDRRQVPATREHEHCDSLPSRRPRRRG